MTIIKRQRHPVVFLAPGAGLGHIVRVSAVALRLKEKEIPSIIATTSRWAKGLQRITGLTMTVIPQANWGTDIVHFLDYINPNVIVQDSFPFGFKNEDLTPFAAKIPFVYLARILKTEAYLKAYGKIWDDKSPLLSTIIKTEPLPDEQNEIINRTGERVFGLDQRICFPFKDFTQKRPKALEELFNEKKVHMIVHSGPLYEIEVLIERARAAVQYDGDARIAVINPALFKSGYKNSFDYFPAAALYSKAAHIYTGGGYNSIAEQEGYLGEITRIPFERYYDDQAFRIKTVMPVESLRDKKMNPGACQAADIIAGIFNE